MLPLSLQMINPSQVATSSVQNCPGQGIYAVGYGANAVGACNSSILLKLILGTNISYLVIS